MNDTPLEEQLEETAEDIVAEPDAAPAEELEAEAPAASGTRLVLKRSGIETDIVFEFNAPATIGRFDPTVGPVDIDLGKVEEASFVSRKHAKIVCEDDVYKSQDLGSSNGTYVLRGDFEKVDEAEINDGDEIALGNARFVFRT